MNFIQPNWPAPGHIKSVTTLRTAWGQTYPTNIAEKEALKNLLQLPEHPIWTNQTHSTIALPADIENIDKEADATFTNQTNRVCITLTADCMPILLCNKKGSHIASIHAGWRGLAGGIIDNTLDALGLPANEIMAWLGPAIGPSKFEVGRDVYDAFTHYHAESSIAFTPHINGKWLADLYTLARIRLKRRGVSAIYGGNFCTYTQEDLFFSYRRDKGKTGRMATLIWITAK